MNNYSNENVFTQTKVQTFNPISVGVKTFIGLIITTISMFYFLSLAQGQPIFVGWAGLFWSIITYAIIMFLYRQLVKGSGISVLFFLLLCVVEGVLFANAMGFLAYISASYYGLNATQFLLGAKIAFGATIIAVVGGLLISLKTATDSANMQFMQKIWKAMFAVIVGLAIFSFVAFFMALLGFPVLYQAYLTAVYGFGPIGLLISFIFILFAEYNLVVIFVKSRQLYENGSSKHLEYAAAGIIVMSIVNIYIQLLQLILKILARRNR